MDQQNSPYGSGGDSSGALLELQLLEHDVTTVPDLAGLKMLFYRLEAISQQAPNDAAVQAAVAQVKQKILTRGMELKQAGASGSTPPTPPSGVPAAAQSPTPAAPPPPMAQTYPYGTPPPYTPEPRMAQTPTPATFPTGVMPEAAPGPIGGPPPVAPVPQAPPPAAAGSAWKRALMIGGAIGLIAFGGLVFTLRRTVQKPEPGVVAVQIATTPVGAQIRINDEARCRSNCQVELAPGSYQVQALLDGFETAATRITVGPGAPPNVNLTLQPSALQVKLYADLEAAQVTLDGQPAGELQQGQLVLERLGPGRHTVAVTGKGGEATFGFEVIPGQAPVVFPPITVKNFLAVLVTGAGNAARLHTSASSLKVALDGQPAGDASPEGLAIPNPSPGDHELTLGEGKDQRKLVAGFSPAPMLTAYLKLDLNAGTLVVSTGEEGVSVLLNGRVIPGTKTQRRGSLRIPALPVREYAVKVAKEGFQDVPAQKVQIRKGEETLVEFKMAPVPKVAGIRLRGAVPGAQVLVDGNPLGLVYSDGTFQSSNVPPGERTVELKRDRYAGKPVRKEFRPGETLEIGGSEFGMAVLPGTIQFSVTPAGARIMVKRSDEAQPRQVHGTSISLPEGTYTIVASAPNHQEWVATVQLVSGETKPIPIALTPLKVSNAPKVTAAAAGMESWDQPGGWTQDGPWMSRRGGGYITFKTQPVHGVFEFKIGRLRGRRLEWFVGFRDTRNHMLFQLEKKLFFRKDVINGKTIDLAKVAEPRLESEREYTLRIEISATKVVHSVQRGGKWEVLDAWEDPARNFTAGKFGFRIDGGNQVGLANFSFRPR